MRRLSPEVDLLIAEIAMPLRLLLERHLLAPRDARLLPPRAPS
jgi:hypothetical protein